MARRPDDAIGPTVLRADVYAGTERPVGSERNTVMQLDLLSTVVEQKSHCSRSQAVWHGRALVSRESIRRDVSAWSIRCLARPSAVANRDRTCTTNRRRT